MPNLVGIGLSQVPTNSMLGGLAYQSPDHASIKDLDLKNLSQINSEIANTAVDIFVYDTSKDSDGGAWRKRTQHTSWYNETLNTSIRGSRREFPAVAVIVAENNTITIYDGDDPDLPMWMVFPSNTILDWPTSSHSRQYVEALNGSLVTVSEDGGLIFKFIEDFIEVIYANINYVITTSRIIGDRYRQSSYYASTGNAIRTYAILHWNCYDVAMTVLPNAPIDERTGLPTPTIAIATQNGVSVIKDDGTVVDTISSLSGYTLARSVEWSSNNDLLFVMGDSAGGLDYFHTYDGFNTSDNTITIDTKTGSTKNVRSMFRRSSVSSAYGVHPFEAFTVQGSSVSPDYSKLYVTAKSDAYEYAIRSAQGLTHISENPDSSGSLVSYATTSYATGWLHGDIKGAFLSDTDATNATYSTVADDWATAGAWTKQSSISLTSTGSGTSGTVTITGNGTGSNVYFFNPITVEANTDYVVTVTFGAYNANAFHINDTQYSTSNQLLNIHGLSGLTRGGHFNSGSNTTLYIQGYQVSTTATTITNIVIQKVSERDRSVNNKGLQVFGTITKSAVATGAELVKYGGFVSGVNANALVQPYNTDMDWGTGDFHYMIWVYHRNISNLHGIISRQTDGQSSGNRFQFQSDTDGLYDLYAGVQRNNLGTVGLNVWKHLALVRSGTTMNFYENGILDDSWTDSTNYTNSGANLRVGGLSLGTGINDNQYAATGVDFALFRTGASAPSPEQIKKIYEDEKVLFQENAACTLYGSSDAVTALAYDEVTEQLHVGTSSGRSDFQGLRRINNTTTAVTTAISAHDEFIVEQ